MKSELALKTSAKLANVNSMDRSYRADIDGLRALAAALVILFHYKFTFFDFGYVGVDIFLVISGYLIYGSSLKELGSISDLLDFYKRRIARILPALTVVILATFVAARWLVPAREVDEIYKAGLASALFVSNIFFEMKVDYFNPVDHSPLLHLWSVSLEEQFYLFFPLLLLFIKSHRRLIASLVALSFLLFAWTDDTQAVFYLLPFRIWEFALGAALVTLPRPKNSDRALLFALAAIVLLATWIPIASDLRLSRFNVVPPVLAAALLLHAGSRENWISAGLGAFWLKGIGRISYSIYLTHWPIWMFAILLLSRQPTQTESMGLIALTLMISYLIFHSVEKPSLLKIRSLTSRSSFLVGATMTASCVLVGGLLIGERTYLTLPRLAKSPLGAAALKVTNDDFYRDDYRYGSCLLSAEQTAKDFFLDRCIPFNESKKPSILIWGDSYGAHLYSGLIRELGSDWVVGQATSSSCSPFIITGNPRCNDFYELVSGKILPRFKPDVVLLAGNWRAESDFAALTEKLEQTVLRIKSSRVIVMGLGPSFLQSAPSLIPDAVLSATTADQMPTFDFYAVPVAETQSGLLMDWLKEKRIEYFSLRDHFCRNGKCVVVKNGQFLTWDVAGHLTTNGSDFIARRLAPIIVLERNRGFENK